MTTEAAVLANVMDKTRALTNMYLHVLKDTDLHKVFEVDGKPLNNVFWIMAHLSVTQNFLLLRATGGEAIKIPWAKQFGLGSSYTPREMCPPLDEVRNTLADIHTKAVAHVKTLNDDYLDQENSISFEFLGEKTVRSSIIHAIRHEGTHAGHLGWLCKLNGIKTI